MKGVRAVDPFTRRQTRPTIVTKDYKSTEGDPDDQQQQLQEERKLKMEREARKKVGTSLAAGIRTYTWQEF